MRKPVTELPSELLAASQIADEREKAAKSIEQLVSKPPRKQGAPRKVSRKVIDRQVSIARELARDGKFGAFTPTLVVALYWLCHSEVYGTEPSELVGDNWSKAAIAVASLVKREFDGRFSALVEYVRWCWARERVREAKKTDDSNRWRITWRSQFSKMDLLVDYRTAVTRRNRSSEKRG